MNLINMTNRLIIVFLVLVALTGKSFCNDDDDDSLSSQNEESTKLPVSSSYDQSKDREQNPGITDHQSSEYGQDNAAGDQDNKAKEGQSPEDSPHTEPASPPGSSDGDHAGEKDKAGSEGEDNTHRQDDSIHFPDDDSDEKNRWNLINQYLRPPASGYGHDQEQDQTDASGENNVNDKDDNKEGQDLGNTSSPSGSSYSHDGGNDQAGSEGKDNKNDQDDEKKDRDSKAEDQKPGGAYQTEAASPSGSGYGQNGGKDQAVSGGEESTSDQNDDKKDQGDNVEWEKTEDFSYLFRPTLDYDYSSEKDQADSEGENNTNDQDDDKNDQDEVDSDYTFGPNHDQSDNTHHRYHPDSNYGQSSEQDHSSAGDEDNIYDQDDNGHHKDDNIGGEDQEGSDYTSGSNHGQSHNEEQSQTDTTSEDDKNAIEQFNAEGQKGDRDGNQGLTGQGVDIGVSEQHVESLTKFGADNVLLIGERDNTIILESNGKNVTIGSRSIAKVKALLNNVTLENYTSAKSSDVMLHRLANLLKNLDSKGYYRVIKSSHN